MSHSPTNWDPELAGLLHDLNNVFQNLVGAADLLSEDPKWQAVSAAILRSVECGRRVAQSFEASRGVGASFDLVLGNAIAFVKDAMLVTRGPAVSFSCHIDPGINLRSTLAWERVLINLFLNAIHAMPGGGEIQVEARRRKSEIRIVVRDRGCGIPQQILGTLFEPRVSTKSNGAASHAGLGLHGLGLHVVKSIVEKDGGTVQAANRADERGAEFTITLPAAPRRHTAHA